MKPQLIGLVSERLGFGALFFEVVLSLEVTQRLGIGITIERVNVE